MTVRMDDLLSGHPHERTLRAALLERMLGPRIHALADVFGIDGERQRAALRQARRPRTALPLLGPWAPPPSWSRWDWINESSPATGEGRWVLYLPSGAVRGAS